MSYHTRCVECDAHMEIRDEVLAITECRHFICRKCEAEQLQPLLDAAHGDRSTSPVAS